MQQRPVHAIWLTTITALIVVPINIAFGIAAAWAVARFRFPGRGRLVTGIEIPFSISPIIASICYLLLYGRQGLLGSWLQANDLQVMFALLRIVLVTMFVTAPFVAREVLPLMQAQGSNQEQAAITLGANGWRVFARVTLPNIKWALLYGAVLCTARAVGEFGGVSVVSGNIRGQTNTLPLHVVLLFTDLNATGAFAAASVLSLLALLALGTKAFLETRQEKRMPMAFICPPQPAPLGLLLLSRRRSFLDQGAKGVMPATLRQCKSTSWRVQGSVPSLFQTP
ncbi:MAG: sulfate ABC transporter permease subunit [Gemmobacter sp.]|nr:sulfate ABC transporter permease subunit [Gemmobacter sp.]